MILRRQASKECAARFAISDQGSKIAQVATLVENLHFSQLFRIDSPSGHLTSELFRKHTELNIQNDGEKPISTGNVNLTVVS